MEMFEGLKRLSRVTFYSALIFLALSISKFIVGEAFNIPILIADGIHNLADFVMFIGAYIGLRLSMVGPTRTFRYGLYKAENLSSFLMGLIIIYASYEIFLEGLKVYAPKSITLGVLVQAVSIVVDLGLAFLVARVKLAKTVEMASAELLHNYQDSFLSVLVLVGMLLIAYRLLLYYYAVLFAVLVLIIYQDLMILKDSTLALLDATDKRIERIVDESVKQVKEALGYHDLRVRKAGPFYFVEFHLELPPNLSVRRADSITDEIESKIKEKEPLVLLVNPHVEPSAKALKKTALIPVDESGTVSNFEEASKLLTVDIDSGAVKEEENRIRLMERRRLFYVLKTVREKDACCIFVDKVEEPVLYALTGAGVEVYVVEKSDYKSVLEKMKKRELKPAEAQESF